MAVSTHTVIELRPTVAVKLIISLIGELLSQLYLFDCLMYREIGRAVPTHVCAEHLGFNHSWPL